MQHDKPMDGSRCGICVAVGQQFYTSLMCLSSFPLSKFVGIEDFATLDAPVPITFH